MNLVLLFLYIGCAVTICADGKRRHKRNFVLEYNWPEPDPTLKRIPHEKACRYYYKIDQEQNYQLVKCPSGEAFDYESHQCTPKRLAKCWSHHFGKKVHDEEGHHVKHFQCPFVWRKYPDFHNCSKFFMCLPEKVRHKPCPPELPHFDKIDRKCATKDRAVCADETDIPEKNYKCPEIWGSYVYSKDCSKYYECFGKNPGLQTCPRNELFDEEKRECFARETVECGLRHNPYNDGLAKEVGSTVSLSSSLIPETIPSGISSRLPDTFETSQPSSVSMSSTPRFSENTSPDNSSNDQTKVVATTDFASSNIITETVHSDISSRLPDTSESSQLPSMSTI